MATLARSGSAAALAAPEPVEPRSTSPTTSTRTTRPRARLPGLSGGRRVRQLALLALLGVAQAALGLGGALAVGLAMSALSGDLVPWPPGLATATPVTVAGYAVLAGTAALGVAALRGTEVVVAERAGQSYAHEVRMRLLDHVLAADLRDARRRSTGGSTLRFVGDLQALQLWLSRGVARLVVAAPLLVLSLAALAWWSPVLGATVAVLALTGLVTVLGRSRRLQRSSAEARRRRGRVAADVTERVSQIETVVGNGGEDRERGRVERRSIELREAMVARAGDVGWMRGVAEAAAGAGAAVLLVAAGLSGASLAEVVAATTLVGFLATPVRDLGRVAEYRAGAVVARRKLLEVLSRPRRPAPDPGLRLPRGPGRLELRGVRVEGVLTGPGATGRGQGVDLVVEPGQVVAVTGGNGAGKSTLLAAVAGLVSPDSGRVLLDGVDVAALSPRRRRRAVGVVSADLPLLRGTVARNVAYRLPDASPAVVASAVSAAGLAPMIDRLPQRERTRVGERGSGLSAGQRARVELARALLGPPRLLVLDEADAALDETGRAALAELVRGFPGSVLLVTHRPELARVADTVLRLDGGQLTGGPATGNTGVHGPVADYAGVPGPARPAASSPPRAAGPAATGPAAVPTGSVTAAAPT